MAAVFRPFDLSIFASAGCAAIAGAATMLLEMRLRRVGLQSLISGAGGLFAGAVLGILFVLLLGREGVPDAMTTQFFRIGVPLAGGYLGMLIGLGKSDQLNLASFGVFSKQEESVESQTKILDTSVLIDGRIADIAESGFLDGRLVVPQFVLHELQLVADSSDSAKRNRGRRGLDVIQHLQKIPRIRIEVSVQDFPEIRDVDLKLIEWAKLNHGKIMTNDFNLNKLAQVQGVEVLNINELANALKPVVVAGESMRVFILKEGREYNQGVAYLDDGTMVVVDNARRCVSKTIDITVTSVLQTTAGKMIFGKFDERNNGGTESKAEPRSIPSSFSSASAAGQRGG
jgi:uncharacterized protein YacL